MQPDPAIEGQTPKQLAERIRNQRYEIHRLRKQLKAAHLEVPSEREAFDSPTVTALWQAFCRTADYRRALEWIGDDEGPGALFVAFRSGLAAALAAQPSDPQSKEA